MQKPPFSERMDSVGCLEILFLTWTSYTYKRQNNFLDLLNYVNKQLKGIYNAFFLALTNAKENNKTRNQIGDQLYASMFTNKMGFEFVC